VIDVDAALGEKLLNFPVREAAAEIPTNGANDDLGFKLPPVDGELKTYAVWSRNSERVLNPRLEKMQAG